MKRSLMDIIVCPVCKGELKLTVAEEEGDETFQGTLMGRRVSYRAEQVGSGDFTIPPPFGFEGSESWVSTIVSADSPLSHLRGVINVTGSFDDDPPLDEYSYSGELVWQTGKKN